jgi:predicted cobalt transporter CbtA
MRVRAHVRLVAAVWLTCQMVAFAAAPFVLCNHHNVMSQMGDGHACSPQHHHHGQPAPSSAGHEHHQHASEPAPSTSNDATINCRCTVSDAALAALILESGILTSKFVLDTKLVIAPVVQPDYAAPTRSQQIDTPPPRA